MPALQYLTDSSLPSLVLIFLLLSSLPLPLSSLFQVCGLWPRICVVQGQKMQKEIDGDRMQQGVGHRVFSEERDRSGEKLETL